jgi:sugar lactone lactonase YvrE
VVTNQTREVMGITATVVTDTETRDGELVEQTADWFAQDRDGNVWYLGEDTRPSRTASLPWPGRGRPGSTAPCPASS